jgi:nitrite reductase (NADH) large subunit
MLFAKCKVGSESMKVVIIGAGMAGSALVDELLSLEPSLEIHLFGEERTPPYNRICLTDLLAGAKLPNQLLLKSLQKFEEEGVKLHLGERVDKLFPKLKKFITSRGKTYS